MSKNEVDTILEETHQQIKEAEHFLETEKLDRDRKAILEKKIAELQIELMCKGETA